MFGLFFTLTVAYLAYVAYDAYTATQRAARGEPILKPRPPAAPKPAPAKPAVVAAPTAAAKPAPAAKAEAPKAKPAAKTTSSKPAAAAKPSAPAAAPATLADQLRNPETGEVTPVPANYRFAKKWIKDALVSENLLDRVYKPNELDADTAAKVKAAIDKLRAIPKYQG